jgi:hypothetical protein
MSDGRRSFWEVGLQTLAVVLVPLTVAGMGWYWTRWQQSVNDLKSMIDLVTDKSPEKQKYGIAMFEYLARQDRVPVEFLAAQIDYATSAENPELLPMLEVAILNASRENPALADAWREARDRRPSRVFVHVPDERIYACIVRLRDSLKDGDKVAIRFPAVRRFAGFADSNQELRFFHAEDRARAEHIAGLFATLGLDLATKDLSGTAWAQESASNSYELWFSGKTIPRACEPQAG